MRIDGDIWWVATARAMGNEIRAEMDPHRLSMGEPGRVEALAASLWRWGRRWLDERTLPSVDEMREATAGQRRRHAARHLN